MMSNNILISNLTNLIVHNILPCRKLQAKRVGCSVVFTNKYPLSNYLFISRCRKRKVPDGLKVYLELSIGTHNEKFLNNWHERLQSFSLTLMSDVLTFCKSN